MGERLFYWNADDDDARGSFWFAGYQKEDGTYVDLQQRSGAVDYGDDIDIDWERWEKYDRRTRDHYKREFERADIVNIAWIDKNGIVQYASLPGGVDLDVFDFEDWVEDYG